MTKQGLPQFYRQRYILALLQIFNCELHRTDFQKYLFLANQEFSLTKEHYAFLPYNYGPFSFQAFADVRRLSELGFIKSDDTIELDSSIDYISLLHDVDRKALEGVYRKYASLKGQSLIRDVYTKYPYFACKSKILLEVMNNDISLPSFESSQALFSIGYEGKTIDKYLNILVKNNISVLVDVRKNPISMKYGFSKSTLNNATKNIGINYLHVPDLGIESSESLVMQTHTTLGAEAIRQMVKIGGDDPALVYAMDIALSHHERWDGKGYPNRISREQIPLVARVMAISDVYDALRSERPYKDSMTHTESVRIICAGAGTQFDPALIRVFDKLEKEFALVADTGKDVLEKLKEEEF